MYKITIKGEARTSHKNLEELDGIDCQECFSEYFDRCSYTDAVTGGYMDFRFENGKLFTYTEYESNRMLTADEMHDLMEYTTGQWSDGIGEGFEQHPCFESEDGEVYISPWHFGQNPTIYHNLAEIRGKKITEILK